MAAVADLGTACSMSASVAAAGCYSSSEVWNLAWVALNTTGFVTGITGNTFVPVGTSSASLAIAIQDC